MQNSLPHPYQIVDFSASNATQISQLYHCAVQGIIHPRYPKLKLNAWSSAPRSAKFWQLRYKRNKAWLALDNQHVIGFISVETHFKYQGYIDCLYVHPNHQHQGIASALCSHLQHWAIQQQYSNLSVDASCLSKPLFETMGFILQHTSYQQKRGQTFSGFYMKKTILKA
ncbi:MAG: GNAT family N-acetyltransferase [Shewanella psychromarinicola]|jgi:putative acetyltransferase|uniref:GNAT family N-acetyltransferase n=1 Tax=Shewanella TaxID=22 RepID=UPI000C33402F|nr:GNAT family N-acetyltransferase [Shewanella sp. Actino-trap-3]PKG78288.1 GNAT family N-acetyltransferase [Shewanella sp. Actino-trap-3]